MAITLDPATRIFSSPQADHSFVSGTLYDVDTDQLRKDMWDLLSSEAYLWMPVAFTHNTEVTVAGVTFARTIEMINSYSLQFTPDSQWTARLLGSNNNFFDVENGVLVQNQVQVISTNSAGLQSVTSGSGVLPSDVTDIKNAVWERTLEGSFTAEEIMLIMSAALAGKASGLDANAPVYRDISDTKDRIIATTDSDGNRTAVTVDGP